MPGGVTVGDAGLLLCPLSVERYSLPLFIILLLLLLLLLLLSLLLSTSSAMLKLFERRVS